MISNKQQDTNKKDFYIETPFNYTGSKYKLLTQLLKEFDYTKRNFVDLFSGGGSVWTNVSNNYDYILINDIIYELIYIQKQIIENPNNVIDKMKNEYYIDAKDKNKYLNYRDKYNQTKNPYLFYSLLLSCTNNMIRFNKKFNFNQTFGKRSFNKKTEEKLIKWSEYLHKSNSKYYFYSEKFDSFINNLELELNQYMFYIDPPYGYCKTNNNDIDNKQISEAGYNAFWNKEDDMNLYGIIKQIDLKGGSFVLSGLYKHNEKTSQLLNKLIDEGFEYRKMIFNYDKVSRKNTSKNSEEIIIKNC